MPNSAISARQAARQHVESTSLTEDPTGASVSGLTVVGIEKLRPARAGFEAEYIRAALARNGGNVSRTAREIGISRVTLQKKLRDLGIR